MTTHSEDLVSLEELRSVLTKCAGPGEPRERPAGQRAPRWRPVLVTAIVVAALAGAGAAIANGFGVFNGIGAAQHPQTGADVIDPVTMAYMQGKDCTTGVNPASPVCMAGGVAAAGWLFDTARVVGQIPSGQNIYVLTTKSNNLCFVVGPPHPEWNCDDPLSRSHPSTIFEYTEGGPPYTLVGIALDGVTSVSFDEHGQQISVPVEDNVWTYQTHVPDALYGPMVSLTTHFGDGTTVVQTH